MARADTPDTAATPKAGWAVMADAAVSGAAKNSQTGGAELAPGAQLHTLMMRWRERLDPRSIPGFSTLRRRRATVSQADMAYLIGVSEKWYGRLERGESDLNYSDDVLDRVAAGLRLSEDERSLLYLLTQKRPPRPRERPSTAMVSASMAAVVDAQPWPAVITDRAWDILIHNKIMAEWLPHIPHERNFMRWLWTHPAARLQLVDYDTVWAPRMLAHLRAAAARWPNDQRLSAILGQALRVNPTARQLWQQQGEPLVYLHPDGDHRKLHLPFRDDQTEVEIFACVPMRADDLRLLMLIPTNEIQQPPP